MNKHQTMPLKQSIEVDVSNWVLDIRVMLDNRIRHIIIVNERKVIEKFRSSIRAYTGLITGESTGSVHYLFALMRAGYDIRVVSEQRQKSVKEAGERPRP